MTERSYPFDAGDGAAIDEMQWSYMARAWSTNGVEASGPADSTLKVEVTGQPFTVLVRAGHAKLAGFHYHLTADQTVLFDANPNASIRVDRLVLRLDRESNTVALVVKKGIQGVATPPVVDRSWETPELPIAYFTVRANSDTVAPADLVDAREYLASGVQMLPTASAASGARQLATGQIGYDPTADRFYAQQSATKFEIGAPPDFSPYLTKTSAQSTYLAKSDAQSTYMAKAASSGTASLQGSFSGGVSWVRSGSFTSISGSLAYTSGDVSETIPGSTLAFSFPSPTSFAGSITVPLVADAFYDANPLNGVIVLRSASGGVEARTDAFFPLRKQTWYLFQATFYSG